jgi:hypothetical protein
MYEDPWNKYTVRKSKKCKNTARPVYVCNMRTHEITRYESLTETEEKTGIDRSSIKYAITHSGKMEKYDILIAETKERVEKLFWGLYV